MTRRGRHAASLPRRWRATRLRLTALEERVVPATSFADFDAVGYVGKTVSVTVGHDQTSGNVEGRVDWKDGKSTEYTGWSYTTASKTFTHTYSSTGTYVIETEAKAGTVEDTETVAVRADVPPAYAVDAQPAYEFDRYATTAGHNPTNVSPAGVRYGDGVVRLNLTDVESTGFGKPFGHARSWSNGPGYDAGGDNGNGWVTSHLPSLVQVGGGQSLVLVLDGTQARTFDLTPTANVYAERFFGGHALVYDTGSSQYVLTTPGGMVYRFVNFTATDVASRGQFLSRTDPNGNVTAVISRTSSGSHSPGNVAEVTRGGGSESNVTESWLYTYLDGISVNPGKLERVTLRRKVGAGSYTDYRKVEYAYYGSSESHGNLGDLKTVTVKDGSGNTISTQYYRWYKPEDANGFAGGLKMAVLDASYARALQDLTTPQTAADAALDDYADLYYQYDSSRRVSLARVQGVGCSLCSGGIGEYTYAYANATHGAPEGFNRWATKTTETLPDGNQNLVYTNPYGQVMVSVVKDVAGGSPWRTHHVYDGLCRLAQTARPSAVTGINEAKPELMVTNGARLGVSPEYRVNSYTTGAQDSAAVGRDRAGNTVVVWVSASQDGSGAGVYAQRFDPAGTAKSGEFRVNGYTTGAQTDPSVAVDADGDFVVAWVSDGQDGSGYGVYAQRYDKNGTAQGSEFRVNSYTTGGQAGVTLAADAAGNFVAVWTSSGQDGSGYGVYAQRYNASGVAQGSEFRVNSYTTGGQGAPAAAMDADGDFAAVWASYGQDGSGYGVYVQRYNASGVAQGGEFRANTTTTGAQYHPALAMDIDGDFVVAWTGYTAASGNDVSAQRYNASGVAQGTEFLVNTYVTSTQELQTVAMNAAGDFLVAWSSSSEDGSWEGVYAKFFLADGTMGSPFRVNAHTTSIQSRQAVAADYDGNFVVAWQSQNQDGSGYGVFARPVERTYTYVSDTVGLVERFEYGRTTTATVGGTAGEVAGLPSATYLQLADLGTPVKQAATQYRLAASGGITVALAASTTAYRSTDGTGGQTTSFAYTFTSGLRLDTVTVTHPTVTTAQNGSNTADTEATKLDRFGRAAWLKDGGGVLTYREFDDGTGAVTKRVTDVNTSNHPGDYSAWGTAPWSTPTDRGLRLITSYHVDFLGRATRETDPASYVTYTFYNDPAHETRVYPDWDATLFSGNGGPTGPTRVYREDWSRKYTETLSMSVAPAVTGGLPTGTESVSSLQSLSRTVLNNAGQAVERHDFFSFTGWTYSTTLNPSDLNVYYYRGKTDYAARGGLKRTETPTGTVTRYIRDAQNRVTETWVGTDDEPPTGYWPTTTTDTDMTKVATFTFDSGGVGDGNLTRMTAIPGGGAADRKTEYTYDWRNRQVAVKQGVEASESASVNRPIRFVVYDNLNHVVEQRTYDGDAVTVSVASGEPVAPSATLMRAKTFTDFDERGRVYQTRVVTVSPTLGDDTTTAAPSLKTNTWFDGRGHTLKMTQPGGLVTKFVTDGAGRVTTVYKSEGGGDTGYGDADDVTGDVVYEQTTTEFDAKGNPTKVTTKHRFHDATATGALGDRTTNPKARITYTASYYDRADRPTATVDVGANGGDSWTRPGTVPSRSPTVLVYSFTYDAAGLRATATDPRAIEARTFYDPLARVTKTVEAYTGTGVPDDAYPDQNKTVEFTYDGSNHRLTYKAWLDDETGTLNDKYQETAWVYGVTVAGGSAFASKDLLQLEKHPDKSNGTPSAAAADQVSYKYNALGERTEMLDRNSNVHTYSFDVVGRFTADAVTTLGGGVDGTVRRLETAFDTAGLPYLFTSRAGSSDTATVVNQVQRTFNGLGQLTAEYQEHTGAVTVTTSPKVGYAYSEMASGANHSRLVTMTNPSVSGVADRTLAYNYNSISRISSIGDGSITLEGLDYLGLGTVVKRSHPQPGVDLTYLTSGATTSDSQDQYTGFDRFGRIIDQKWTNGTADLDRWQYGYDENGNRLYRDNTMTTGFDELYHADGSSNGYDNLNQLREFQRGTFIGTLHTIASETRKQTWTPNLLGNFDTVATTQGSTTTETRSHNRQNQLTSIVVGSTTTTLTYDNAGNMTTDNAGKALAYDAWNRLANYDNYSGSRYAYDALNRRLKEATRAFYYSDNWQVLEERSSGTVQFRYAWSPVYVDAMMARDEYGAGSMTMRLYVLADATFNVTALISDGSTVLERYVYDAYGVATKLSDTWGTFSGSDRGWRYLHQGGRWDAEVYAYGFRMRDTNPTLARWLTADPMSFYGGDANYYRYQHNAPTTNTDWLGLYATRQAGTGKLQAATPMNPNCTSRDDANCKARCIGGGFGHGQCTHIDIVWAGTWQLRYVNCKCWKSRDGDCTKERKAFLQGLVDTFCKPPTGYRSCPAFSMTCSQMIANSNIAFQCALHRETLNRECYQGGDVNHKAEKVAALNAAIKCSLNASLGRCLPDPTVPPIRPNPVLPTPMAVPVDRVSCGGLS